MDYKFVPKHYALKTYEQIKPVLMDPNASAPAIFYHMIRGTKESGNVTVLEPGNVGGEYIKTVGHYHIGNLQETYFIKNGQGVALLQKPKFDSSGAIIPNEIEEFKVIKFVEGDDVFMPGDGWGHVIINTGEKYLVTIDDTIVNFDETIPKDNQNYANYEAVVKMQGFAYYVIDNNGTPALKKNPKYSSVGKTDFGNLPIQ